ncbi:unnamed protein product [Ceratitis capitata]|uniref:(Mediterranean fruit fly) hypothetical protein n=1 Tax=Ceratitis capitata TaxID=7213 RepID=A0A811UCE3_CERCA|nr:unnamed protein product [Ceratitis capitata]
MNGVNVIGLNMPGQQVPLTAVTAGTTCGAARMPSPLPNHPSGSTAATTQTSLMLTSGGPAVISFFITFQNDFCQWTKTQFKVLSAMSSQTVIFLHLCL